MRPLISYPNGVISNVKEKAGSYSSSIAIELEVGEEKNRNVCSWQIHHDKNICGMKKIEA